MEEKLVHAYLIVSDSNEERVQMAVSLAQQMLCEGEGSRPCGHCRHCRKVLAGIHPDVIFTERERDDKGNLKREYSVQSMRDMVKDAWIRPNEAERKVYIVPDAQTMSVGAQNTILKLLEEPPGNACFILCSSNASVLLDTVRSRCVERSGKARAEESFDGDTLQRAEEYLRLAGKKDLPKLIRLLTDWEKLEIGDVRSLVRAISCRLTEALCLRADALGMSRETLHRLLKLMDTAEDYLRVNVSAKHIFGLLAVDTIPEEQ